MATEGIKHPGRAVQKGGSEDQRWEDSRNFLPPVPGSRNTVGGGIRATCDKCMAFLPVETECPVTVHRVRKRNGARVAGITSTGAAQEGNGRETELGNHGTQR